MSQKEIIIVSEECKELSYWQDYATLLIFQQFNPDMDVAAIISTSHTDFIRNVLEGVYTVPFDRLLKWEDYPINFEEVAPHIEEDVLLAHEFAMQLDPSGIEFRKLSNFILGYEFKRSWTLNIDNLYAYFYTKGPPLPEFYSGFPGWGISKIGVPTFSFSQHGDLKTEISLDVARMFELKSVEESYYSYALEQCDVLNKIFHAFDISAVEVEAHRHKYKSKKEK